MWTIWPRGWGDHSVREQKGGPNATENIWQPGEATRLSICQLPAPSPCGAARVAWRARPSCWLARRVLAGHKTGTFQNETAQIRFRTPRVSSLAMSTAITEYAQARLSARCRSAWDEGKRGLRKLQMCCADVFLERTVDRRTSLGFR